MTKKKQPEKTKKEAEKQKLEVEKESIELDEDALNEVAGGRIPPPSEASCDAGCE